MPFLSRVSGGYQSDSSARKREIIRRSSATPASITMTLTSTTFNNFDTMPIRTKHNLTGCNGSNTSPQLTWTVNTLGTIATWRLRCIDIDASNFIHWSVDNIPASSTTYSIPENVTWTSDVGIVINNTDWIAFGDPQGANGYGGPCPFGTHRYQFTVTGHDSLGNAVTGATATITGLASN